MDPETKAALADAVNTLVTDEDAKNLYTQMQGVIEVAARNIPVALVGRPAILNPLITLALKDEAAFGRVIELVERKRAERNLPPLEQEFDRRKYMREFMAVRRERLRRLVELWNELRSENDKLRGTKRVEFEQLHAARWKEEKDRREEVARVAAGGRLPEVERKQLFAKFWEDVDGELSDLQEFVRTEMRKPLHSRSREGFKFKVGAMPKKVK